tara:strand:+ start:1248 stop:2084 length:837 start_codon:yes stop_codon:yes gene_type:complete
MIKEENCGVCGTKKTLLDKKNIKDPYSLKVFCVYTCASCSVGYTHPVPENIESYYDQEGYDSYQKKKSLYNTIYSYVQSLNNNYKIKIIKRFGVGMMLDYGAGSGSFVNFANKKGFKAFGYEPINANNNKKITNTLGEIVKKKYKFITLWHVLEHTKEPKKLLSRIKKMLTKDGIIVIAVPNSGSYDNTYYKNRWAGYDVPRHLYHFNTKSFERLVLRLNMRVIKTKPLYFDAFYVSMLSEKNKNNPFWFISGVVIGFLSNICAFFTKKHSSIIYIIK